ncbi:hypothetical protein [Jiangella asiatica]|uniref:Uncharacterized protein n=1 Tax=Jiangella asiatica TaxID=2530372 RepID=A0A4R5CMY0_9ACTN|nr:hypothetical protein [Jiangella asiatica]TDD98902.1 hypothetical protein E1269_28270 [Jiangella asiatica]
MSDDARETARAQLEQHLANSADSPWWRDMPPAVEQLLTDATERVAEQRDTIRALGEQLLAERARACACRRCRRHRRKISEGQRTPRPSDAGHISQVLIATVGVLGSTGYLFASTIPT